ncbi:class I SAM-dependent methyltransferase [Streptacidiphilus monticola]|uniref:Class I SAM-dependent methyltransferase n=1 Tax=Streptacidiphilus monticola TaxID=2161674 RepID=A0ABW1G8F0_9ACTN
MFSAEGPTLRELAVQALSSVERGYDLLAPKFDATPFRTSDVVVAATEAALRPLGPFTDGLDLCCGTGAGLALLRGLCAGRSVGLDFSAGMLGVARSTEPGADLVRADARALPFADGSFDLAVSFGAFGHFLPAERPALWSGLHAALRPGGCFAFPVLGAPGPSSPWYWALLGFDAVMRARNALRKPEFVMYYRTFRLTRVLPELEAAGFQVSLLPLPQLGPAGRLVLARRPN